MARAIRIQFPGATYHVMARGNHGQDIFRDDQDRIVLLETLAEACEKTGWRVHAYVLMPNHYHLLLETPEPNLVTGMKWLQGTYTQRHNSRHKTRGHLFQGRYKAVLVEGGADDQFQIVGTYIHLNPARAKLIRAGEEPLARFRWSSYPLFLDRAGRRPGWLSVDRVLGSLGLAPGDRKGYEAYIEGRVLELASPEGRKGLEEQWRTLRRGWYLGGEEFRNRLQARLAPAVQGRRPESFSGAAKNAHDEAAAELLLRRGTEALGLPADALQSLAKGAPEKIVLAWWLRERSTVPLRWVSERLGMGHCSRVSQAVSRMRRDPGRRLAALGEKLAAAVPAKEPVVAKNSKL